MRRRMRLAPVLALIAVLVMGTLSVSAYSYEISVSAGNGSFAEGARVKTGAAMVSVDQTNNTVTVGDETYTLTEMPDGEAPADSKYFLAGVKLAGEDNSNAGSEIKLDGRYKDRDLEFVVSYGLRSSMVSYVIHYVDTTGAEIRDADTFYGVAGDDIIVSYKYVEGYIPQALTGIATLSSDPEENDFTFVYNEAAAGEGNVITIIDGTTVIAGGGAAGAGAGAGAAGAGAGAGAANIGDGGVPLANQPADTVNLNDGNTPTTDQAGDGTDVEGNETPGAGIPTAVKIGGGVVALAAIAAIAAAIARSRRDDDDEDDEDDDE